MNRRTYLRLVLRWRYLHARIFYCDNWLTRIQWELSEDRRLLLAGRIRIPA